MGTLSKLRRLVLRDKVSIRQASRQLGISRNTATRWLQEAEVTVPRYPTRQPPPGVLDAFREQLSTWLKADSYRNKRERRGVKALYQALQAMGYSGSSTTVYRFAKDWREELSKPRGAGFVPMHFELGEAFKAHEVLKLIAPISLKEPQSPRARRVHLARGAVLRN